MSIPISMTLTMKWLEMEFFLATLLAIVAVVEMRSVIPTSQDSFEFQSETTSQNPFEFPIESTSQYPFESQIEPTWQNPFESQIESTSQMPVESQSETTSQNPVDSISETPFDLQLEAEQFFELQDTDGPSEAYLPAFLDDPADYWNQPVLIGNITFTFLSLRKE